MNLARYSITPTKPTHIFDARFDADCQIFTACTPAGFAVYKAWPMALLKKRELTGGTLAFVQPLHCSSLLFLVGGGRSPLYPANKVILWDESLGAEVAELEFRERVRGLACRRGWLAVALRRRVVVFQVAFGEKEVRRGKESVRRYGEWDTTDNPRGLVAMATATGATLLAIPGRSIGHVQLIHLPPCAPPTPLGPPPNTSPSVPSSSRRHTMTSASSRPPKNPASIIPAHETALTVLACPPSGRLLATTSARGTLVRVWDVVSGSFVREFRRGTDRADIFGVAFRPDEQELCVWSDKGTVHVFALVAAGSSSSNRQSALSQLSNILPMPKYFGSEWSYAQYRIPAQSAHISLSSQTSAARLSRDPNEDPRDEERCAVGWVEIPPDPASGRVSSEYQLIALTWTGGWYRLGIPGVSPPAASTSASGGRPGSPTTPSSPPSPKLPLGSLGKTGHRPRTSSEFSVPRHDKGKGKEKESAKKEKESSRDCVLQEYRKFGRWDGWG